MATWMLAGATQSKLWPLRGWNDHGKRGRNNRIQIQLKSAGKDAATKLESLLPIIKRLESARRMHEERPAGWQPWVLRGHNNLVIFESSDKSGVVEWESFLKPNRFHLVARSRSKSCPNRCFKKIGKWNGFTWRPNWRHRDIKPANLLLDRNQKLWIADFGVAKAIESVDQTRTNDVVGTLRYMAPEHSWMRQPNAATFIRWV